jgi:hypothetical protein
LGFANFYRIFIKDYSKIAGPLTCPTGTDKFVWDEKAEEAFETLKKAFTSTPILVHAGSSKPFFLEVDALDFALGSVLSQYGENGRLHPIVLANSLLQRLIMKFMTKSYWPLLTLLKNGAIYLKEPNI